MRARFIGAGNSPPSTSGVPARGKFSVTEQIFVAVLWFALFAQWMTVLPIIVPAQIVGILGPNAPLEAGAVGTIGAAGAFVALIIAPLAGALSDRHRGARGRRRPFLIVGMLGSCVALDLLTPFGPGSSLVVYGLAIMHLQFWWNWAAGPYAGLIPDVVPPPARAAASGWMNVMSILGIIIGNVLMLFFYRSDHLAPIVGIFIELNIVCLLLTLAGLREPPAAGAADPIDLRAFVRSFYLDPRLHSNFYWVLVTRLLANLGIWSVINFLLLYLVEVVGLDAAAAASLLPELLLTGAIVAIPATFWGVRLADRRGVVSIVRMTSWIMAAAVWGYVLIAMHPDLVLMVPALLVYAAANGAYGAVDWALALKVIPAGRDAGKDMGIWHICMVLPQVIGPLSTGWLITGITRLASARVAYAVAFAIAALWFTLAAVLVGRVRLPPAD
jgi:Na+/melibiose symporter-like transporter